MSEVPPSELWRTTSWTKPMTRVRSCCEVANWIEERAGMEWQRVGMGGELTGDLNSMRGRWGWGWRGDD